MKIALVWPFGFDIKYVMPLALGYLKSNLDKKHDARIIDCSINKMKASSPEFIKILKDFNPDMVCVSCWAPTYKEAIRVLKVAKAINPGVVSVMGGVHVTSYAHYILGHERCVDFMFRGEAELSFPKFVEEIESGNRGFAQIKGLMYIDVGGNIMQNDMERADELDTIKFPDYKAMDLQGYLKKGYKFNTLHSRNAPVWITRGCPYRCQFCAASLLNGKLIRRHSIEYSMKWIRYLRDEEKMDHINIIDDNFTFDTKYAKEFCKVLIDSNLGITIGTPNGVRMQRLDDELCGLMKKAGWENVVIAPESGSVNTLERMQKDLRPEIVPPIIKMIKKHGIKVHGFFILGYPGDTKEDLKVTLKFLHECDFDFFFLNNFQALPGTPIFDELVGKGEITSDFLPRDYSDGSRAYTPKDLIGINFPKLILAQYLKLYAKDPRKLFYAFKLFPPQTITKKIFRNLKNSLRKKELRETMTDEDFGKMLESIKI